MRTMDSSTPMVQGVLVLPWQHSTACTLHVSLSLKTVWLVMSFKQRNERNCLRISNMMMVLTIVLVAPTERLRFRKYWTKVLWNSSIWKWRSWKPSSTTLWNGWCLFHPECTTQDPLFPPIPTTSLKAWLRTVAWWVFCRRAVCWPWRKKIISDEPKISLRVSCKSTVLEMRSSEWFLEPQL